MKVPVLDLLFPVGISFYAFQTLSYTIDVYFRNVKTASLWIYALFVTFFLSLYQLHLKRRGAEFFTGDLSSKLIPLWKSAHPTDGQFVVAGR